MGAEAFAAAKPGLILINTARGPIVDLDALEAAMRQGNVAGRRARRAADRAGRPRSSAARGLAQRRGLDRQPPDRHPARRLLQPGVDGRPAAEVDRGGARLSCRGPAHQLRQPRVPQARERGCRQMPSSRRAISPYARRLARERGIALDALPGSGPAGRVVAADILAHVAKPVARYGGGGERRAGLRARGHDPARDAPSPARRPRRRRHAVRPRGHRPPRRRLRAR